MARKVSSIVRAALYAGITITIFSARVPAAGTPSSAAGSAMIGGHSTALGYGDPATMKGMRTILASRLPLLPLVLLAALSLSAGPAGAAEISAFAAGGKPGETWGTGYGGMLTITLFNIVHGDVEGAWQGSDLGDRSIVTAAAKAYVGPSIGRLVPYAGLGAGVYRESLPGKSDQGTSGLLFAGAKLKFPFGLVLRAEYQWITLPEEVLVPLDDRYLFAVGLSF
jgi:hypothetical protein